MERVFVYEHLTGGGMLERGGRETSLAALLTEGRALRDALTEDLLGAGWAVDVLEDSQRDTRPPAGATIHAVEDRQRQRGKFRELASRADHTILIAPECGGVLLECCRQAERSGARLRSPPAEFVAVAADKQQTVCRLAAAGVPVPSGVLVAAGAALPEVFAWPALVKPLDGAGSLGIRRIPNAGLAAAFPRQAHPLRLETFCSGLAASVALLCGPAAGGRRAVARGSGATDFSDGSCVRFRPALVQPLPAARQHLAADGSCRYRGGSLPLEPGLCRRAQRLGLRALQALPPATGWIGIDLILGPAADGSADVVVEVNPRLTSSYVGLRRLCRDNLAAAMLGAAVGQPVPIGFDHGSWQFDADGRVRPGPEAVERIA